MGWSKFVSYDEWQGLGSQGRRDATKILTIATAHVEYESEKRHYAHVDCPATRLREEHDHGAAQMDGAIVASRRSTARCRRRRAHPPGSQVNVQRLVVYLNKVDLVDDPELLDLVEMEIPHLLKHLSSSPATRRHHPRSAIKALRGEAPQGNDRSSSSCRRWTPTSRACR